MTANQIAYHNMRETQRANRVNEGIKTAANTLDFYKLGETIRHNDRTEKETVRHNLMSEANDLKATYASAAGSTARGTGGLLSGLAAIAKLFLIYYDKENN